MRPLIAFAFLCFAVIASCQTPAAEEHITQRPVQISSPVNDNPYGQIGEIPVPDGYKRIPAEKNSFAAWLRGIRLKKAKTVFLFNNSPKRNQEAQFAVLDISRGDKDLQQCADAVMRLRAEYFFTENKFDRIIFTDNEGRSYRFTAPYSRQHLQQYLETVFGMCGSASLAKQLKPRPISEMQIGDVFIRGGFPGHAVIITDMAANEKGEKIFLIAQSYMPAQDIHILKNLNIEKINPWYRADDYEEIYTPEYTFKKTELRTW